MLRSPVIPAAADTEYLPLPSCATVQTAGVSDEIVTARPEDAVAVSATLLSDAEFIG